MRLGKLSFQVHAAAHAQASVRLEVDENEKIYVTLFRGGAGAQYTITDAFGEIPTLLKYAKAEIEATGAIEEFELHRPPAGPITLKLEAGSTDAEAVGGLFFVNGRRLAVGLEPRFEVAPGDPIRVRARILDASGNVVVGRTGRFTAELESPDAKPREIGLYDDGTHGDQEQKDGIFGATIGGDEPLPEGGLDLRVRGIQEFDTYAVERTEDVPFHVKVSGAGFVGGMTERLIDSDGNGLYDELVFEQEIDVSRDGTFHLTATVHDPDSEVFTQLHGRMDNPKGIGRKRATLSLRGEDIARRGLDGRWKLTEVSLFREDVFGQVATAPNYVSRAYSAASFERPPGPRLLTCMASQGPLRGGFEISVLGSGLGDTTEVLVDGQRAIFSLRDDSAIGVEIPPSKRQLTESERAAGGVRVEFEVRTKWGKCVAEDGFFYTP